MPLLPPSCPGGGANCALDGASHCQRALTPGAKCGVEVRTRDRKLEVQASVETLAEGRRLGEPQVDSGTIRHDANATACVRSC
jgi:hypothetical protein